MYVRVTLLSLDPARYEEVRRFTDEHSLPRIRQLPGYHSYTSAGDRTTGHGLTISVWDTMEQAQEMRTALGSEWTQQVDDLGAKVDAVYVYEIVTQV